MNKRTREELIDINYNLSMRNIASEKALSEAIRQRTRAFNRRKKLEVENQRLKRELKQQKRDIIKRMDYYLASLVGVLHK